jgi:hypothetical protein
MYSKKKNVKVVPAPKSYVADMVEYREKKKVINEKIFVDNKPKKKLNKKNNNNKNKKYKK